MPNSLKSKAASRDEVFWDDELAGFRLRRKPSGALTWVIQYRNRGGTSHRLSLGDANVLTPAEARSIARKELSRVAEGHDPVNDRRADKAILTFTELVDDYQTSNASWLARGEASRRTDEGRIRAHLAPLLGTRRLDEIDRHRMEFVFRAICAGDTAVDHPSGNKRGRIRVTGGAGTARRTMALASAIFAHGVRRGLILTNSCTGIKTGHDGQRDVILEGAADYERLFAAIAELDKARTISGDAAKAITLIALTGCRRGEIVGLRWANVDLDNGRIILQAEHKAGWRTGRPKIIALPAMATEILKSMTPGAPDSFVIRSAKNGARIDLKGPWARIRAAAGWGPLLL